MKKKRRAAFTSAALKKFESSGLSPADAEKMGYYCVTNAELAAMQCSANLSRSRDGFVIPYIDPVTGEPYKFNPAWPPYYRVRFLGEPTRSLKDQTSDKAPPKYWQPPKSGCAAYFPPIIDWKPILADTSQALVITEGELKAAKACKEGLPTVSIGGVDGFVSSRFDLLFLPDLEKVDWFKRDVYIVYDSDIIRKQSVARAAAALAEELWKRGALPHIGYLPEDANEEDKVGLDDYLLEHTADDFRREVLGTATGLTTSRIMFNMNNRVLYVKNMGMVLETVGENEWEFRRVEAFEKHSEYTLASVKENVVLPTGAVQSVPVNAAKKWLGWPMRAQASKVVYEPGFTGPLDDGTFSTWPGWGCEPAKGDTAPFDDLFNFMTSSLGKDEKKWLLQWFAYPLQNPGAKLLSSVVMHGAQGTGKTFLGRLMEGIYGRNFISIGQAQLDGSFNDWLECRQFIVGDEVLGNETRKFADKLKGMVTNGDIVVSKKYIPTYVIRDCVNYYFTSNHPDAFFMEDDDRRYFVCEVPIKKMPDDFYARVDAWKKAGGAAHLFYKLLRVDLAGFNPNAAPPQTAAKRGMRQLNLSDHGAWLRELVESPDDMLRLGDAALASDLYSVKQLLAIYDPLGAKRLTAVGMAKECKRAGLPMADGGRQLRVEGFGQERYYIIRNRDKWEGATAKEAAAHVAETRGRAVKGKY